MNMNNQVGSPLIDILEEAPQRDVSSLKMNIVKQLFIDEPYLSSSEENLETYEINEKSKTLIIDLDYYFNNDVYQLAHTNDLKLIG
jgi:hypothetical protein